MAAERRVPTEDSIGGGMEEVPEKWCLDCGNMFTAYFSWV